MAVFVDGVVVNLILTEDDMPETETLITYETDNPAYIGGDYFDGMFYPPKPYESWLRDNGSWVPPVPYPDRYKIYRWDEESTSWILVSE